MPEVASEALTGDELIGSIQRELAELDKTAVPVLKKGRIGLPKILAIVAICLFVLGMVIIFIYLYVYRKSLFGMLLDRLRQYRDKHTEAQLKVAFNNAPSAIKVIE